MDIVLNSINPKCGFSIESRIIEEKLLYIERIILIAILILFVCQHFKHFINGLFRKKNGKR